MDKETREKTCIAIARMVKNVANIQGLRLDLVDLALERQDQLEGKKRVEIQIILGLDLQRRGQECTGQTLPIEDCVRPFFWQTETGKEVRKQLHVQYGEMLRIRRANSLHMSTDKSFLGNTIQRRPSD